MKTRSRKTKGIMVADVVVLAVLAFAAVSARGADETHLSLDGFLGQVKGQSLSVKAAREASEGARMRADEGKLLFAPQLFAEGKYLNDKRQQPSPATMGTSQEGSSYQLGVMQQTRFGLKGRVYTELDSAQVTGVSPVLLPVNKYNEGHQTLELTQSLWRNGFGSELRAQEAAAEASAQAKSLSEGFRGDAAVVQAEVAYWRLAAARESARLKQESLDRAVTIRDWNLRRNRLELGKKSDLLQAEAAVKLATLDLKAAHDEERMASWAFNTARNVDGDSVPEQLDGLDPASVAALVAPGRTKERDDVRAAERLKVAADAQASAAVEKNLPQLDLSAQFTLNGKDLKASGAYGNSFNTDHPTIGAGVKLVVPLGKTAGVDDGYRKEAAAAEIGYRQKKFEVDREWSDLTRRFDEAKGRLALALEIEQAQKEKYLNERQRHQYGQSTTYQVLVFEQDYTTAELNRVKLHTDVLQILAQLKLFRGA